MVMEYSDIFTSIDREVPHQNWYDPSWKSSTEGPDVWLYNDDWIRQDEVLVWFHCYGQGDDPEQNPLIFDINVIDYLPDRSEFLELLDEEIAPKMRPLIGWEPAPEDDPSAWYRKQLPSDPITVVPRVLEEFAKLQPIARSITEKLDGWLEDRELDPGETQPDQPVETGEPV